MSGPTQYSVGAGGVAYIQGPVFSLRVLDFADDCLIQFEHGEKQPVLAYRVINSEDGFERVTIIGGASAGMTVEVLHEEGELPGGVNKKPNNVSVAAQLLAKNIPATPPAAAGDSFFAIPTSWVGGTIHIVVNDVAQNRTLQKWIRSNGAWRPAGQFTTDFTKDVTEDVAIFTALDGFALQVVDGLGALNCDIYADVTQ